MFWGAGLMGKQFLQTYQTFPGIYEDKLVAFIDRNEKLWHCKIEDILIISPEELKSIEFDKVVITSQFVDSILSQLLSLGVNSERICTLQQYKHQCYTEYQYRKRYEGHRFLGKKIFDKKIVVYTSITGRYDDLKTPLYIDNETEYVCFTNNRQIKSSIWNVEYISDTMLDNMYLAKKIKMFPDLFFRDYETSVWVDGKLLIKKDLRTYIEKYEKTQPVLCFPHFERNCIYEEMAECIRVRKGNRNQLLKQITAYFQEGYPANYGLYEMGCIVRKHHDEFVKEMMQQWWEQVKKYSYRDQISFPYVCWKNDFKPDICDLSIVKNDWIEARAHLVNG